MSEDGGGRGPWGRPDGPPAGGGGPRAPWGGPPPGGGGGGGGSGGPRGPSLEELFRKRGFNLPGGTPDGRRYWPLAVGIFALLWVAGTSVWQLEPGEEGVITTLGEYSHVVGSGLQFTAPAPFQRLEKVDTQEIRTLSIGGQSDDTENLVLTSDQNIVDMAYQVRWSVKEPSLYLFQLEQPDTAIREVAESAMRAAVANFPLIQAIGPGRAEIEGQVRDRMQRILDGYRSGVLIQGVAIRESDPPAPVTEAFRNVNAAQQRRESYMNDARGYAQRVLERARGDTAAFDKVYEQYRLAPEVTRRRMYYETMEAVLGQVDKTVVEAGNVTPYLPLPEIGRSRAQREAEAARQGGGQQGGQPTTAPRAQPQQGGGR